MTLETGVQSQVESYQRLKKKKKKLYLIPPYLTLSIIKYVSRVKWSNTEKGVAPFSTLGGSSYWKGSLRSSTLLYCWLCTNNNGTPKH